MMYAMFAIGLEEKNALLCHHCTGLDANVEPGVSSWEQEIELCGPDADNLIADLIPRDAPGLWVWQGNRVSSGHDIELQGIWSKATKTEAARYINGAPPGVVFADRVAEEI